MPTIAERISKSFKPENPPVKKPSGARLVIVVVLIVVAVLVAGLGTVAAGVYTAHWESSFVSRVARAVPLPALSVNGHWRPYSEYLDAVSTLDYSLSKPSVLQASGYTTKPSPPELRTMVLDRMAKEQIVIDLANKRGVRVAKADVDAEMARLTQQTGNSADVEAQIKELYRWDVATFRKKVIEPYVLRQKLQDNIAADKDINASKANQASQLLDRVKNGKEDFQAVARQVNEDATRNTGGEMGVFGKGERDPAIEEAAFAMQPGDISDVIRTLNGFYLIKLVDKIPADPKTSQPEKVHTIGIFLSVVPLDQWLFDQSKQQTVSMFMRGYRWNKDTARVVSSSATGSSGNANTATTNSSTTTPSDTTTNTNTNASAP